jgi:hypothetical protein
MLIKIKQGKPELSQTKVAIQVFKLKHNHNLLINIIPLISYVLTATNKWYSYPRVTAIRINVHPVGET